MSPFIREISQDTAGFTSTERTAWTNLGESATVQSLRLVSVNGLPSHLNGDQLTLLLPGTSDTLRARGLYLQKTGDTTYTWWGELPSAASYVGMAANGAGKLMTVSTATARYMLYPLSSRYNALVELYPPESGLRKADIF